MTKVGCSWHAPNGPTFRVIVSGSAWQKVAQLDDPLLATATDEQWAFVIAFDAGHVEFNVLGTGLSLAEVAFGDDLGPHFDAPAHARIAIADPNYLAATAGPLRSWPSFMVRVYAAGGRGAWPKARRPALWARVEPNGETGVAAAFSVSGISFLAFKLDSISASKWVADRYAPAAQQNPNGSSRQTLNWRTFHQSAIVGAFAGAGDWLVFSSTHYEPASGTAGAPLWQTTWSPDGTVGAQVPLLGRELAFGMMARGSPRPSTQLHHRYAHGGVSLLVNPANGGQLGLRGVDPNPTGFTASVDGWEVFAIRTTALGLPYVLQKDHGTPPPGGTDLEPLCADVGAPLQYPELVEYARPATFDVEVVCTHTWLPVVVEIPPVVHAHAPRLRSLSGRIDVFCGMFRVALNPSLIAPEGVPLWIGQTAKAVGAEDVQFQVSSFGHPALPLSQVRSGCDFCFASWVWDDAPNYDPDTAPAAPIETYLVPPTESLAAGSLPTCPVQPNASSNEEHVRAVERMLHDDGTLRTWPLWLTVRRVWSMQWPPLSHADRAAVRAVVRSAWQYTDDRGNAVALLPFGSLDDADAGSRFGVLSGTFVELRWTS